MSRPKAEMSVEQKENGQYVEQVVYPFVEYDHVTMENGMDIMSMIRDDVSTPTVTHNTTSWKVGQGDSDVSESIVDSSVASMTIKGQTYQNILPSPSLRNSMTNGKTMQKLNEGYDSVSTVDGVCKSAILSGQTLNYLLPYKSFSCSNPQGYNVEESNIVRTVYDNHVHYSLTLHSGRVTTISFNHAPNKQTTIYAGKTYTLYIPNYTHQNVKNKWLLMRDNNHAYNYTPIKQNSEYFVFTAIEDFDYLGLYQYFDFDSTYLEKTVECNVSQHAVIVEGDYFNQPLPLLEQGLNSCKMPVLTTTGKNLFKGTTWTNNKSIGSAGQLLDETDKNSTVSDYYNVEYLIKGIEYQIPSIINGTGGITIAYYDKDKNFIRRTFITSFILNENEAYVRFKTSVDTSSVFQIEQGSTTTSYEPFKSNILTTPEDLELRGIGNVKDELNVATGELTQRIGEIVLDGSEEWASGSSANWDNSGNTMGFYFDFENSKNNSCYSDKLPLITNIQTVDAEGIYIDSKWSWIGIRVLKTKLNGLTTIDALKSYLSQNHITVQYQLATPIIKTVDLSILDQDNQPVTQLNSFANGYIQVSSQEGLLIPTTEYEVPTSNSYHVDLMKANTQYTMKNMQGTFTIDGVQYNASVNGTFTSPSTLSNRLMITNMVQTQPMLLEGDMTSKEVPYVEGIKSAFEGVDKVEIYSVGKNLFDGEVEFGRWFVTVNHNFTKHNIASGFRCKNIISLQPSSTFKITGDFKGNGYFVFGDKNQRVTRFIPISDDLTTEVNEYFCVWYTVDTAQVDANRPTNIRIEPINAPTQNTTSFQLSHSLRSLPNGVRDEIVLDRVNHKAKIIQRVGEDLTQLDTPIVTEVNLEGYPYVYKDGHIFLNTEIAPTTEVTYSINQAHQIESSNEDILRHQKEINHLYELIAQYVQVQYEAELIDIALQG